MGSECGRPGVRIRRAGIAVPTCPLGLRNRVPDRLWGRLDVHVVFLNGAGDLYCGAHVVPPESILRALRSPFQAMGCHSYEVSLTPSLRTCRTRRLRCTPDRTVRAYAVRLAGCAPSGVGMCMAAADAPRDHVTDRGLAACLLDLRDLGRVCPGGHLGSRQRGDATGGRNDARERLSRDCDQRRRVFVWAHRVDVLRAHSVGPSPALGPIR
jgi:hypothetical protein